MNGNVVENDGPAQPESVAEPPAAGQAPATAPDDGPTPEAAPFHLHWPEDESADGGNGHDADDAQRSITGKAWIGTISGA